MRLTLDHRSPVPLFHQIAEALRYRIATGEVKPGTVLPPLRRAAEIWGVNLHTVRRAYSELARLGVVTTSAPGGTRVLSGGVEKADRPTPAARHQFLQSVLTEARLRYGLGLHQLIGLLRSVEAPSQYHSVSVVECSQTQCDDLAQQIEERWRVSATPWVLGKGDPPPDRLVVATYFHYNDIRLRWPERLADVRFLAIAPAPELAERLRRGGRSEGRRLTVVLREREEAMARNITADLARILPSKEFRVVTEVVPQAKAGLEAGSPHTPILFSPRMWGELPAHIRRDPRLHQVRYVFDSAGLEALGVDQGWDPR